MELQLLQRTLEFSRRRRKLILLVAAFGVTGYGVFKLYYMPSVAEKRRKLLKLFGALVSIAEAVSDSAETISIVSKDLKQFLQSDSDQVPTSLRQISKIARSDEFSDSVTRVSQALTMGVLRGYQFEMRGNDDDRDRSRSSYADRIMDKLTSGSGAGFVSVVVGSFARNLAIAVYSCVQSSSGDARSDEQMSLSGLPGWVNVLCSGKCREVIADCVQLFVSTAVGVYLEKTMNVNTYDELFSGLTNPKHERKVRDILVSVCNGAVETLVKTSHKVMTNQDDDEFKNLVKNAPLDEAKSKLSLDGEDDKKDGEWIRKMSSTLAVPSNRRFVLDVTGRVTFETIRSILDFLMWKLMEFTKRSADTAYDVAAESGMGIMRYVGAKASVIHTICIALCLHVLDSAKVLMPA